MRGVMALRVVRIAGDVDFSAAVALGIFLSCYCLLGESRDVCLFKFAADYKDWVLAFFCKETFLLKDSSLIFDDV